MVDAFKDGDFLEVDYTGKVLDDNIVFDTTSEDVAKNNKLYDPKSKYDPVKICLGKKHVIAGLDKNLVGKEVNKKYVFKIQPSEAFGNKDPKMIQLIATNKFKSQNINPIPGLQVNMDGVLGTVKAVSGGRTIVDFNHPLSGKELEYEVTVKRIITDITEKVDAMLKLLNLNLEKEVIGDKVVLKSPDEVPKELKENISKALTETVSQIKEVSFEVVTKKQDNTDQSNNKI